jgi:hypothetical protein
MAFSFCLSLNRTLAGRLPLETALNALLAAQDVAQVEAVLT